MQVYAAVAQMGRFLKMSRCGGCNDVQKAHHIGRKLPGRQCRREHWFRGEFVSLLRTVSTDMRIARSQASPFSKAVFVWIPTQERCIASLLQNTLRTCANCPLEIPRPERPTTLYKDVEIRASAIASSLRTAASYFGVSLPCQAGAHDEKLNRSSPSFTEKLMQPAMENLAVLSKARTCVTVGLLMPPVSASLLSALLAVWSCGACSIVLPYPDATNLAVVADSERASTADTAVIFSKRGMTLVTYSADSLVGGNIGSGVYDSRYTSKSTQSPCCAEEDSRERRNPDAFVRQWEYYLTESGCRLLVASPEVAPAAAGLSAKLSVPMCIVRLPGEKLDSIQRQERLSAAGEDRGNSHISTYVREVPYSTRKISPNITRWRALQEADIKETQKEYKAPYAGYQAHRAAMLFYENSGVHSPRLVVYTHRALQGQVLRNMQLLELTPADAVVLFAPDPTADCSPLGSAVSTRTVNHASERLWGRGRMMCAPKGLLTVALPAFAAGASLSIITTPVTDCINDFRPSAVYLQPLSSKLPDRCTHSGAEASHGNFRIPVRLTGGHGRGHHTSTSAPDYLKGVQLWEALASMRAHKPGEATRTMCDGVTRSQPQVDDYAEKQDICGVSLLAMDVKTAAAMLAALQLGEEGLRYPAPENTFGDGTDSGAAADGTTRARHQFRTSNSTSDSQHCIPGKHFLPRESAQRYLGAARALRLVCICTDEEDLEEDLNCTVWGTVRRSKDVTYINTVVHGWQDLVSPRVKVLHLCSLTQVGLVFWDDGRMTKKLTQNSGTVDTGYLVFGEGPEVSRRHLRGGGYIETMSSGGSCEHGPATLGGIVPSDMQAVVDCETGLLKIRSPHGATGYYNRPRSTAEAFGIHGEFRSSFQGLVVPDRNNPVSDACSSAAVDHRIILQNSLHRASAREVPLLYRLVTRRGPKMERHIEGWVKKRPIAGRDWCNLHAPKRHRKQMFR